MIYLTTFKNFIGKKITMSFLVKFAFVLYLIMFMKRNGRYLVFRSLLTWVLNMLAYRDNRFQAARSEFRQLPAPPANPKANHPHGQLAADRELARKFAVTYCALLGYEPYMVCESPSEQEFELKGNREYYWTKDTQAFPHNDPVTDEDLLISIDCDYYLDMNSFLISHGRPMLLYTIIPESVACNSKEYAFTFDADSNIVYRTTGGSTYRHVLWNYNNDVIQVHASNWSPYIYHEVTSMAIQVEVKRISPHHYMVLLLPFAKWKGVFGLIHRLLSGNPLSLLKVVFGQFTRLDIMSNFTDPSLYRSTGMVNGYHCANIPAQSDSLFAQMAATGSQKLTQVQIISQLTNPNDTIDNTMREQVVALQAYHNSGRNDLPDHVSVQIQSNTMLRYQFNPNRFDPEAKSSLEEFMQPFMIGCYVPDRTKQNEQAAVDKRVTAMRTFEYPTKFTLKCMKEFLSFMIPEPHTLHPVDYDEVFERQARPSQRSILNHASMLTRAKRMIKAFLKSESYDEAKAPRIISTVNDLDKLRYSSYMYAVAELLKRTPWYAFGKTPKEISVHVASVAMRAKRLNMGDISKMDGSISPSLRVFERALLLRAFPPCYHKEIIELHDAQFNIPAVTTSGVRYQLHTARASGASETAPLNSADNGYASYCAARLPDEEGNCLSAREAYASLGLFGGDDSINVDTCERNLVRAYKILGLTLKSKVIERGEAGVEFLARQYSPRVWLGAEDNCCSLPRQLVKFHTCVKTSNKLSPTGKLIEKCLAFWLTDQNTPIIGPFACKVLALAGVNPVAVDVETLQLKMLPYWTMYDKTDQFPNNNTDLWMDEYLNKCLPNFDQHKFVAWVNSLESLEAALKPPLFMEDTGERKFSDQVVINGVPHVAPKTTENLPEKVVVPMYLQPDGETYRVLDDDAEPLDRDPDLYPEDRLPNRPIFVLGSHRIGTTRRPLEQDALPPPVINVTVPRTMYTKHMTPGEHNVYLEKKANQRLDHLMEQVKSNCVKGAFYSDLGPIDWVWNAIVDKETEKQNKKKPKKEAITLTLLDDEQPIKKTVKFRDLKKTHIKQRSHKKSSKAVVKRPALPPVKKGGTSKK